MAKKSRPGKALKADKSITPRRDKARRLMASANISDYRVRRILECYAGWMTVAQASAELNISHVTIGRIFTLIRQRLIAARVFDSLADRAIDLIDGENNDGPYFDQSTFEEPIQKLVAKKRGVADENRAFYEAEALFREQNPAMKGAPLMQLLLQVVKDSGPLDRPPRRPLSMSAQVLLFRAFRADAEKMVRVRIRAADSRNDPVSVANWQALTDGLKSIEKGVSELRDEFNRVSGGNAAHWQAEEIAPSHGLRREPPPSSAEEETEELSQTSPGELPASAPMLNIEEARARWHAMIADARHHLAELRAANTGAPREWFEIERVKLFINFCSHFAEEPGLIHSPAAAILDEQFAIDELDLAKRFGIAE